MATDTESASRKTFRLDPDTAQLIANNLQRYGTENKTVNALLCEVPKLRKVIAEKEIFHGTQQAKLKKPTLRPGCGKRGTMKRRLN